MPRKTGPRDHGYDRVSDTVRVGRHDLARLLLMFRSFAREQAPGSWRHMDDYDVTFEKLADAVDEATKARQGDRWAGPDLRMRCTTTEPAYKWPQGAPYDGGTPAIWRVKGYGSHATLKDGGGQFRRGLCGLNWLEEDARRASGLPDCPECLREVQLGGDRPRGGW